MNRIRLLRLKNNLKQDDLCKIINVSQASLSGYENGKFEPDNDTLLRLAAHFNVSVDYLLGYDESSRVLPPSNRIPVLKQWAETQNFEAAVMRYEEISYEMTQKGEHFALEMQDDSMEPRIRKGDTLIFKKQNTVESGAIGAVVIGGSKIVVKKVIHFKSGLVLIPLNTNYSVQTFTSEEMKRLPVTIAGQAVELRGKC